jgi:hypothetical protein
LIERSPRSNIGVYHYCVVLGIEPAERKSAVGKSADGNRNVARPGIHVVGVQIGDLVCERAFLFGREASGRLELKVWHMRYSHR